MAMSHHELRKELFSLLSWHMHRTDASPLDTLQRLAEKAGVESLGSFVVSDSHVAKGLLATLSDDREAVRPRDAKAPIILINDGGRLAIIDGQKRAARFRPRQVHKTTRCLIVTPRE